MHSTNQKFSGNAMNETCKTIKKSTKKWLNHTSKEIKDIHKYHNSRQSKKCKLKKNHNKRWKKNFKVRFKETRNLLTCIKMTSIKQQISISWNLLFCKIPMMILEMLVACGRKNNINHLIMHLLISDHKEQKVWFQWIN